MRDFDVVVVGGGITGLVAARRLAAMFDRVLLVERSSRLGGLVQTRIEDGYLIETGPDGFVTRKGSVLGLVGELAMEDQLIHVPSSVSGWWVYTGEVLQPVSAGDGLRFSNGALVLEDGEVVTDEFASLRRGMGSLTQALSGSLGGTEVHTEAGVTELTPMKGGWRVDLGRHMSVLARGVVLAVPASVAAALLRQLAPDLSRVLGAVERRPALSVSLAYRTEDLPELQGTGFIVTGEHPISGVSYLSRKWAGRVPGPEHTLVRVFLRLPWPSDPSSTAHRLLAEILGLRTPPVREWSCRVHEGFHVYLPDHARRMGEAEALVPEGLRLAGAGFHGVGLNECIDSGEQAARRLVDA